MRNPYVEALVCHQERTRDQLPPRTGGSTTALPERVEAFFAAMEINHRSNRARVCTGIAHTMSNDELDEAVRRLEADQNERADKLQGLGAPTVIVTNERNRHRAAASWGRPLRGGDYEQDRGGGRDGQGQRLPGHHWQVHV